MRRSLLRGSETSRQLAVPAQSSREGGGGEYLYSERFGLRRGSLDCKPNLDFLRKLLREAKAIERKKIRKVRRACEAPTLFARTTLTLRNQQKQTARLSPTLILWALLALFIGTVLACWYAFLYHREIAYQLSGISVMLFIVIAAIVLSLAGNLSESSLMKVLMKVLDWATSYAKSKLGLSHKTSDDGPIELQANADDDDKPLEK